MKTFEIRYNDLFLFDIYADEMVIKEDADGKFLHLFSDGRIIMSKMLSDRVDVFEEGRATIINFKQI